MHRQQFREDYRLDRDGNPAGGFTLGTGIDIKWQDGPVAKNGENGAQPEHMIQVVLARIEWLDSTAHGKFSSVHNQAAMQHLHLALCALDERTAGREHRGVEGTHAP